MCQDLTHDTPPYPVSRRRSVKPGGDSLAKKDFCCVDNFSVLIPYKDLEHLFEIANKLPQFQQDLAQTRKELQALRTMYSEALQKIAEINRYL